jgi:hypothetical protein
MPSLVQTDSFAIDSSDLPHLPIFPKLTQAGSFSVMTCFYLLDIPSPLDTPGVTVQPIFNSVTLFNLPSLQAIPYWLFNNLNSSYTLSGLTNTNITGFDLSPPNTLYPITHLSVISFDTFSTNVTKFTMPHVIYVGVAIVINNFEVYTYNTPPPIDLRDHWFVDCLKMVDVRHVCVV